LRPQLPFTGLDLCGVELALLEIQHSGRGSFCPLKGRDELVVKGFGVEIREMRTEMGRLKESDHPHLCSAGRPWPWADGSEASAGGIITHFLSPEKEQLSERRRMKSLLSAP
jgi:hypothetical protein